MHLYDVFICHASEDKDSFVRPLAEQLERDGIHVWYDEFSLTLGDSLRRSIDLGLSRSRFGIVVLSHSFFAKQWPQQELSALFSRQLSKGEKTILPILHNISHQEVLQKAPLVADIFAMSSSKGMGTVIKEITRVVHPQGSPLIVARDLLIEYGLGPPVVTDEWWLDVVEASNREPPWGVVPEREHWHRWAFPLPPDGKTPKERGERLGWTALQLGWTAAAAKHRISQISPPEEVLAYIDSQPGLFEMCWLFPEFLGVYAPQLTISGLGGPFEELFDREMQDSIVGVLPLRERAGKTVARRKEWLALRDDSFLGLDSAEVACDFVQGPLLGPPARVYERMDYLVWLLADDCRWLPGKIRHFLLEGMIDWGVWPWDCFLSRNQVELGCIAYEGMGNLVESMMQDRNSDPFEMGTSEMRDLVSRTEMSVSLLGLQTPVDILINKFLDLRIAERARLARRPNR